MSYSRLASAKFASLCQSQMALLDYRIGDVCSVVYLTSGLDEDWQARLFPFAIYPQPDNNGILELPSISLSEVWQQPERLNTSSRLLAGELLGTESIAANGTELSDELQGRRLLLPLIHEEKIFGLLVAERQDRTWQETELAQVEEIAKTMAVARWLDLQYQSTQARLVAESNLRRRGRDRLDDLLHQLRNPLTAIKTFSKLLLRHSLPDRDRAIAENILREGDRFAELLEQFESEIDENKNRESPLTLSASSVPLLEEETGSNFLLPESRTRSAPVELKQILEPLLETVTAIAAEKNITLITNISQDLPLVWGESKALREVLNNLIDNALKYTLPGGKVRVSNLQRSTQQQDWLGIAIEDTGCGISPQDKERIFERHYRGVQAEGDIPGSGLGLAIALELVEQMHGEIELISPNDLAEDDSSGGTTFIIWLRVAE